MPDAPTTTKGASLVAAVVASEAAAVDATPDVDVDEAAAAAVAVSASDGGADVVLSLPERGLFVAGWAGDPRRAEGLYLATIGRGLFRFVPAPPGPGLPDGELSAPAR